MFEIVSAILEEILESGSIFYPSKSAKDNVEFLPGYGLRKVNCARFSWIKAKVDKFFCLYNMISLKTRPIELPI